MPTILLQLAVRFRPTASLKPNPTNPRRHSKAQVRTLSRSIAASGYLAPILVDESDTIIAGHGRLEAASELGLAEVPTLALHGLSAAQRRALTIADNRIAQDATWDEGHLIETIQGILEVESDFDLSLTGLSTPELDGLFEVIEGARDDPADDQVPVPAAKAVPITRGDLFNLGEHRLFCGDATDPADYERLLGETVTQLVITDPPYNVPIAGHVSGNGRIQHREFTMASGEMDSTTFQDFLLRTFQCIAEVSCAGALAFVFMDWRHLREILDAGGEAFDDLINLIVWSKTNAGMGSLYRSQHELVLAFKVKTGPHINNVELGRHGRHRSNVWAYAGANAFGRGREAALSMHPTVKPVAMIADAIKDASHRGGIVLDPFAGSGTILIAAHQTGRRAYAMELDTAYVDLAIRRWQEVTGLQATHARSGLTYREYLESREPVVAGDPS
jgi:DNA modification methylase